MEMQWFGFDFQQQVEGSYGNMKPAIVVLRLFHPARLGLQCELQILLLNSICDFSLTSVAPS